MIDVSLLLGSVLLEGVIGSVLFYGWLPFLIYGVARRRRGEGGKRQLTVAGAWVALLGALIFWDFSQGSYQLSYILSLLDFFLFSAWVPLLIWGIVRRRRKKKGGIWMTAVGGVWYLLAVSVIGYLLFAKIPLPSDQSVWQVFNPETHTGTVATVEFPYTGEGNINLKLFPVDPSSSIGYLVHAVDTNRMMIPAGEYRSAELSVQLEGVMLDFCFDTPFTVAQDEVFTFSGGFPFKALIHSEQMGQVRLNLYFSLTDSAGNRVRYRGEGKKIGFEALSPDGKPFWRGDFEWGREYFYKYLGQIPPNAPTSFTIRPVLPVMPFKVEIRESELSR